MAVEKKVSFLLLLGFALLVAGCGEMRPPGETSRLAKYTVRPGDTLYSIAWRYGYDHREVAAWNGIKEPYPIYPGQELVIIPRAQFIPSPPTHARQPSRSQGVESDTGVIATPAVIHQLPQPGQRPKPQPQQPANKSPTNHPPLSRPPTKTTQAKGAPRTTAGVNAVKNNERTVQSIAWRWPAKGRVVNSFGGNSGGKGVDIGGQAGQGVFAAATGSVVYSGDGLIGYGNLIIIKHNDTYLSAYAHNSRLLVREGDRVTAGQKIAEMGQTAKSGSILHFEIRQNGEPVDPLRFLPK